MSAWPTVALGELFEIARGGSPRPIEDYVTDDPDGINWVSISDASESSKFITRTKRRIKHSGEARSRRVQPGDFLLTNSMSFGRPYIMQTTGCIHDGWLLLRPRREIHPDYFFHLLGSDTVYAEFSRLAAGVTVKNLNIDLVSGVKVGVPPVAEQRRIAAILDEADALRAKRRAALAHLDEMARAIFVEMLGDPATNPRGWPMRPLAALCSIAGQYGAGVPAIDADPTLPRYIRITDINDDGTLKPDSVSPGGTPADWSDVYLRDGDVLFARSGATVGKTFLYSSASIGPCVFAGYLIRFRPAPDRLLPSVLFTFTKTQAYSDWVIARQRVVAQPNINAKQYGGELMIPVPPIALQQEFETRVRALGVLRSQHGAAMQLADSFFTSLQHRAFRGEL